MAKPINSEIKEIVRIIAGIERESDENNPILDRQLGKINEIFNDFNKKYPKISLIIEHRIDGLKVRILINETSVKKVFDDCASKLKGLVGIGLSSFDEATLQQADKFASLVNSINSSVFLSYSTEIGLESIILEWNEKQKKVNLNYEIKSLINILTPQHQLLADYSAKETDKSVNFINKCFELGFIDVEDEALLEWEDEFYPKMLE